jgi:hypothetical protein
VILFKDFADRIYWDYFSPNRLNCLEIIYTKALCSGYKILSCIDFWDRLKVGGIKAGEKFVVNRHDIDSDPGCVSLIVDLERRLNITSSFYFRLSTANAVLMNLVKEAGSEASYHYEELATLVKKNGWKADSDINWKEVRNLFLQNYTNLKKLTGLPLRSISSHGDFANRLIGIPNHKLLTNELKCENGIEFDVYDKGFMSDDSIQHTDINSNFGFTPYSPLISISESKPVIHLLTHPRQLRSNLAANTKENLKRFIEGIHYNCKGNPPLFNRTQK